MNIVAYWHRRVHFAPLGRWNPLSDDLAVEQPWSDLHIRFFNPRSVRAVARTTGFVAVQVSGFGGEVLWDVPGLILSLRQRPRGSWMFGWRQADVPHCLAARCCWWRGSRSD